MSQASHTKTLSSSDQRSFDAYLQGHFIDLFLSQSLRAQIGLLLVACLCAFIWFGYGQTQAVLVWLGLVLVVTLLRVIFSAAFVRRSGRGGASGRIALLLLINGVLMAQPLLAFTAMTDIERAALSIILLVMATASVVTTSGYRMLFLAFTLPMLLPLAAAWAWLHAGPAGFSPAYGIAALIVFFQLSLLSMGLKIHQDFEESVRFRYGEKQLNRDLQVALAASDVSSRAKTQFLAAASHDLRQPIHCINVLVTAIGMRSLDRDAREIVTLLNSANQLLTMQLDGLLDISKLDAGAVAPRFVLCRLDHLLAQHHQVMSAVAAQRGLVFDLDIVEPVSAFTDEAWFTRVLSNLTDNAFKYTKRGGCVRLCLRREGAAAVVSVADSGIGIAHEDQAQVFREFFQVAGVNRDRSPGLGLGLSIVQRLCKLLDMRLALQSEPGNGTTISLSLAAAPDAQSIPSLPPVRKTVRGLRVLVIDDEESVRQSMRLLLAELGCIFYLADGLASAVGQAERHEIDFVLSDCRLGRGERGIDVVQAVCRLHPRARAALISASTTTELVLEAQELGVPLLSKPMFLASFLDALQMED